MSDPNEQHMSTVSHLTRRIGFCGLGRMGEPMALRLLATGHELRVWNRTLEKAYLMMAHGASARATPAELADDVDIGILCLADGPAVDEVVFGKDGFASAAHPPAFIVDHSTLSPAFTRALAERWRERTGGVWIDAPVSGGTVGAREGTLAIMAGGEQADIDTIEPVLGAYASRLTRMGSSGAGQVAKLANQTIVVTTIAAIAEASMLAGRAGVDAARLPDALRGGWADSVLLQGVQPRMLEAGVAASASIRTMLKDLDAIGELSGQVGATLPVVEAVRLLLQKAMDRSMGDEDISQIIRVLSD
jgi:3-hydroxyisobutyrate dehydrogenase-like beta-hydroxyacid dehydrogenase